MKIGFDGKRAINNFTGLGNYSRSLIMQLAAFFPQNQYLVYTQKLSAKAQVSDFLQIEGIEIRLPSKPGFFWRTWGITKQLLHEEVNLFHGLSHEIPIGIHKTKIATVVTIHDLIFLRYPEYFNAIDRFIYMTKSRYACKHADKIVAISEQTKRDIISYYNIDPDRIDVVYQGCDDSFKTDISEAFQNTVRSKYSLPQNYILNVGTIERRKSLDTIVKAMKTVDSNYHLVVVGKKTEYFNLVEKEIANLGLKERILFLENIPFADLPAIYQMATVFVYPSIFEGFGIPIIEALYSKVPVIAAKGSCLEEAGGENSLYITPRDHDELASMINMLIENPEMQKKMTAEGREYVRKFDDEVVSTEIMNVYHSTFSDKNMRQC